MFSNRVSCQCGKSAQTTRICRTGGTSPGQQCLRTGCVAGKRKKTTRTGLKPRRSPSPLWVVRHQLKRGALLQQDVHRSSRCSSSKARERAVSTAACLSVETERFSGQRGHVSTRHQSIEAAGDLKRIPRGATLSALYGGTAAQGARPGPGQVSGRAARGDPRTSLVSRKVDRRIGYRSVAMRTWYTTLLPT